jgi:hypothetical protein
MGMLSKSYIPLDNNQGYIKNKKEVVLFTSDNDVINKYLSYPKINLNYANEIVDVKNKINGYSLSSKYFSYMLLSQFNKDFFDLKGQDFREIRETRNKYRKNIVVKNEVDSLEAISFIREWITRRGDERYGWQLHAGYDINFFTKYYNVEKDKLWCNSFYIDSKLVGYSIVSKEWNENYKYLIRKNDTDFRNLCLYIDFYTFERMYNEVGDFIVNWGANGGSLLTYKKKFPIHSEEKKWFYKFKKNEQYSI